MANGASEALEAYRVEQDLEAVRRDGEGRFDCAFWLWTAELEGDAALVVDSARSEGY